MIRTIMIKDRGVSTESEAEPTLYDGPDASKVTRNVTSPDPSPQHGGGITPVTRDFEGTAGRTSVPDIRTGGAVADTNTPTQQVSNEEAVKKTPGVAYLNSVKHTRTGATWTGVIFGSILLIVLLIFIVQNQTYTQVVFFQWSVSLPVGVLLLAAAIVGVLGTALVGAARMFQLWRAARKSHKN